MIKTLRERLRDVLELAYAEDLDLNNALADHFLEGVDHYRYFKDCADDLLEGVYDTLEEDFLEHLERVGFYKIDARKLAEKIYKIRIKEKPSTQGELE